MSAAGAQVLQLPSVIDLDVMDEIREWLINATGNGDVQLKAADVERCATNALLMLVTAAGTANRFGFSLKIASPSAALKDAIARLGLTGTFTDLIEDA